jgi:hypothetical protein
MRNCFMQVPTCICSLSASATTRDRSGILRKTACPILRYVAASSGLRKCVKVVLGSGSDCKRSSEVSSAYVHMSELYPRKHGNEALVHVQIRPSESRAHLQAHRSLTEGLERPQSSLAHPDDLEICRRNTWEHSQKKLIHRERASRRRKTRGQILLHTYLREFSLLFGNTVMELCASECATAHRGT